MLAKSLQANGKLETALLISLQKHSGARMFGYLCWRYWDTAGGKVWCLFFILMQIEILKPTSHLLNTMGTSLREFYPLALLLRKTKVYLRFPLFFFLRQDLIVQYRLARNSRSFCLRLLSCWDYRHTSHAYLQFFFLVI